MRLNGILNRKWAFNVLLIWSRNQLSGVDAIRGRKRFRETASAVSVGDAFGGNGGDGDSF